MTRKFILSILFVLSTLVINAQDAVPQTLIDNQGFSFTSLWRGVLGMVTLLLIAFSI